MAGTYPRLQHGPATFKANVTITGGQLVEPDSTTGRIKPAGAGSKKVLGVALTDASPAGSGNNLTFSTNPPEVAVAYGPAEIRLKAAGAIAFGDQVVAGALGTVATIASGTFDQVVGRCTEPAGIASGAFGLIRLGAN